MWLKRRNGRCGQRCCGDEGSAYSSCCRRTGDRNERGVQGREIVVSGNDCDEIDVVPMVPTVARPFRLGVPTLARPFRRWVPTVARPVRPEVEVVVPTLARPTPKRWVPSHVLVGCQVGTLSVLVVVVVARPRQREDRTEGAWCRCWNHLEATRMGPKVARDRQCWNRGHQGSGHV